MLKLFKKKYKFIVLIFGLLQLNIATTKAQNTSYDVNSIPIGGVNSVGIGIGALQNNTGQFNTAVGINALKNTTAASSNTAIGFDAMRDNVSGFFNTAVGLGALRANQLSHNTGLGWGALASNTTGQFNVATGADALINNIIGSFNTANGFASLYNNLASYNTALGVQALFSNTTGEQNTANGYRSLFNNSTGWYNTANGYHTLFNNSTGRYNTASGYGASYSNTIGESNTAAGHGALYYSTTANNNTANGFWALHLNTTGNNNMAMGWKSLYNNITGSNNTAVGNAADVLTGNLSNTTALGSQSVATESNAIQLGNNAVAKIFAGVGNTATIITGGLQVTGGTPGVGKVLTSDATGVGTWQTPFTGIGGSGTLNYVSKFTPDGITLGNSQIFDNGTNIGIGTASPLAKLDITGNIKIADGTQGAGKILTSDANGLATWQTPATGSSAGWQLTGNAGTVDGVNFIGTTDNTPFNIRVNNQRAGRIEWSNLTANSFYGFRSGISNTTGQRNTGMGWQALQTNTSGNQNTAIGERSLEDNDVGYFNTGLGAVALGDNTSGYLNTAVGVGAMRRNTTGNSNTAVGLSALRRNTTGTENTAIGVNALSGTISGNYNTALGAGAECGNAFVNATAIGANANASASNRIRIGDAAILRIEANVAVTVTSDGRFKKNVREKDVKGIEFIKKLRPVVYNFDGEQYTNFVTKNMPDSIRKSFFNKDFSKANNTRQSGFIAQEVEKAAKESGYNFNGVYAPENENDNYSIAYSTFVVPLVKAAQEQQQMIEDQQNLIEGLKKTSEDLTEKLKLQQQQTEELMSMIKGTLKNEPVNIELKDDNIGLSQNVPNPFTQQTSIGYNIPKQTGSAQIVFYSLDGRTIKSVNITARGKGQLNIQSDALLSGAYTYSLLLDGRIIDTKKMVKQ